MWAASDRRAGGGDGAGERRDAGNCAGRNRIVRRGAGGRASVVRAAYLRAACVGEVGGGLRAGSAPSGGARPKLGEGLKVNRGRDCAGALGQRAGRACGREVRQVAKGFQVTITSE